MVTFDYINEKGKALAERIQVGIGNVETEAIVFIGAMGICVRRYKDKISDKYTDPAIICVDTNGKWVIPVLSGHIGGANDLSKKIAKAIGAEAVITTQSDNEGLWALDTLANKFNWNTSAPSRENMNKIISKFVAKKKTALIVEHEDEGSEYMKKTCPPHVDIYNSYEEYKKNSKAEYEVTISVGLYTHQDIDIQFFQKCVNIGFGCQKQAPKEFADLIIDEIENRGFSKQAIASVRTIDIKKSEAMLNRLQEILPTAKTLIFTAKELDTQDVPNPSEKVREVVGCSGVAEASAMMNNAKLVVEKQKMEHRGSHCTFAISIDKRHGHIEFVGAGPGDPELISIRGKKFIEKSDLVLYAGSLVPKEITNYAKEGATVKSSADMSLEEQFELMKKFYDQGKLVTRLHTGDPCIYGAIQEQMAYMDKYAMDYHITPGISSFLAAAAELKSQFTIPEKCQTIILTRGEGRTPMPEREKMRQLAQHQSTMCIFLSAGIAGQVQKELIEGGYPEDTPIAACHKLTWKEQKIVKGKLKDLSKIITDNNMMLTTMIVVGEAIDNRNGQSKLYDRGFTHGFRQGRQ